MKLQRSFTVGLFLRLLPVLALAAAMPWLLAYWMDRGWEVVSFSALLLLALMWWTLRRATAPMRSLFRALAGTVSSYRDGEYNFGVHWRGDDELGEMVAAHRQLGDILREQRQGLAQRELMLDTIVQNTPVAMLLTSNGGDGLRRVVFSNLAARKLLHGGWKLEGQRLDDLLLGMPPALREAVARGGDSLFTIDDDEDPEEEQVYHLSRRRFRLNGRPHELLLIRLLTAELRRQEVHTWKKVIRVISHELNNSLAPIASLAHSGAELVRRQKVERLEEVFGTIEERARHLEGFIRGYARFAKLPQPQLQTVHWAQFLGGLQQQIPFALELEAHALHSRVDPAQLQQALLNLVKNAHESSPEGQAPADSVRIRVSTRPEWLRIEVLDRGSGMNEAVLHNALMPFYSTKRNGTGLGLALTREIVEAHGGRLSLQNRDEGGLCVAVQLPLGSSG
ncbi:sensor histidine kinase [Xanthomonas translucens]|uniref:sensor histidine kinase n=1 Tax=Xanthomonas campestris pv. translucens TaxID=343 RepID=UPI00071E8C7D|nr:HAMP domain-containing sensor histidine kinase [Xanthomonas translucens]UKE58648.1 HAMP domain-containing histidine kinase [Xanthomonas translucens pv. hordei]KTF40540.1 histidine kinase [Xanthomonas translucens pv. translucens]KWV16710.1 histidine kinase [Xanthomonas translucens]MCS3358713.1 HAMP domain-containing histidine kinase [Xanthomonas translucens pv. translucens]MCS3372882.1 HAMP domain-containing histidine kinase [Xanthomonas translucens pv. translucens]